MRLLICLVDVTMATVSAEAQQSFAPLTIRPSFSEEAVNADKFDAIFNVLVTTIPAVPLFGRAGRGRTV